MNIILICFKKSKIMFFVRTDEELMTSKMFFDGTHGSSIQALFRDHALTTLVLIDTAKHLSRLKTNKR